MAGAQQRVPGQQFALAVLLEQLRHVHDQGEPDLRAPVRFARRGVLHRRHRQQGAVRTLRRRRAASAVRTESGEAIPAQAPVPAARLDCGDHRAGSRGRTDARPEAPDLLDSRMSDPYHGRPARAEVRARTETALHWPFLSICFPSAGFSFTFVPKPRARKFMTSFRIIPTAALVAAVVLFAGCSERSDRVSDLSTPKTAVATLLGALNARDSAAVKDCFLADTPAQQQYVAAMGATARCLAQAAPGGNGALWLGRSQATPRQRAGRRGVHWAVPASEGIDSGRRRHIDDGRGAGTEAAQAVRQVESPACGG